MTTLLVLFVALAACGTTPSHLTTAAGSSLPSPSWRAADQAALQTVTAQRTWYSVIVWHNAVVALESERQSAPRPDPALTRRRMTAAPVGGGSGRCGGDLPPCWVMMRESRGNIDAYNPSGCSGRGCFGKWQCDPRSCDGTGTEEQQDAEARRLWAGGAGCSHWNACG